MRTILIGLVFQFGITFGQNTAMDTVRDGLIEKGNLVFVKSTDKPFTGILAMDKGKGITAYNKIVNGVTMEQTMFTPDQKRMEFLENGMLVRSASWYLSGAKRHDGKMIKGKRDGKWQAWYEDGAMKSEINYVNGMQEGLNIDWYPNGNKRMETMYANDKMQWQNEWYENGKKKREYKQVDGVWVSKRWDPAGNEEKLK